MSTPVLLLPSTAALLVAGGDTRIALDASGRSMYGSRPWPDPGLVALGSCTASLISAPGYAAADALRTRLAAALASRAHDPARLYAEQLGVLRAALRDAIGCAPGDGTEAILAASGTDLFVLASQWLQPVRTVMICPQETGSGVPAAVQGRHFNTLSACGATLPVGEAVSAWLGELVSLSVRDADGALRDAAAIDADCVAAVSATASAGGRVLLVLTDVSKTGLIAPAIDTALALKRRWPDLVEVLVDACQFRLRPESVRAYLANDCLVAVTGSKFMAGPTFCGALLVGAKAAARHAATAPGAQLGAYSSAAEWPPGWRAAALLPARSNFGLLLRWQATLPHLAAWAALPEAPARAFVERFAAAVRARLAADDAFGAVPVPALVRAALGLPDDGWDAVQTIFPFIVYRRHGARQALDGAACRRLYQQLRDSGPGHVTTRFQLGQPVPCGERDGVSLGALRLCVDAPMLAAACAGDARTPLDHAAAALDRVALLADTV
jgi:hypothetical protein